MIRRSHEPRETPARVLVVDDEESMRHFVTGALTRAGFDVSAAGSGNDALEMMKGLPYDVLVTDIRMPGLDGKELFEKVRGASPGTRVVLMTAYGSVQDAIDALQHGAESYLTKPFENDELLATVTKAAEKARLLSENRVLREQLASGGAFAGLVGVARPMRKLYRTIEQVARRSGTVLVTGESGTGKELVARAIHARSPRREGPFVAVHCGALPTNLVEAELFGVVEGAFTGADRDRTGYVERAAGGTLFLDEIAEVPVDVQPSLLRFLESGEVMPVGAGEVRRSDVRVIAASNRDLRELTEEGRFRPDLYYRLNVLPVPVPALRDRAEDIPLLVARFLEETGRGDLLIPPHVMTFVQGLPFPGNVRELRNLTERLASTVEASTVEMDDLPKELRGAEEAAAGDFRPYRLALEQFERTYLESLLERTRGNVSEAARLGGIGRPSLHARMTALGIDVSRFRTPASQKPPPRQNPPRGQP